MEAGIATKPLPDSLIGEPPTMSDSDWETQSEHSVHDYSQSDLTRSYENAQNADLTLEQPVRREDVVHLTEIPVSVLAEAPSMSWLPMLKYTNPNKSYERSMVSSVFPLLFLNS